MRVACEPHDGTQTATRHDERAEKADAMVTRSVARDEDPRADDDPATAPMLQYRRTVGDINHCSPGRNIVTTISQRVHAEAH